jgi:hypothetical protein
MKTVLAVLATLVSFVFSPFVDIPLPPGGSRKS